MTQKSKKNRILSILALILFIIVLPLGSWYYLNSGLNYYKKLMGELKDYGELPAFTLTNQNGQVFTKADLKGKVVIADFFFTHCPTICPKMTSQMKRLYEQFDDRADIVFLSHTVDPKRDSVSVLQAYMQAHEIPLDDQWYFLTGNQDSIFALARKGYQLPTDEGAAGDGEDFLHSPYFALLDTTLTIRNYYDGTDSTRVNRLVEHIAMLMPRDPKKEIKYKPEIEK